MISSKGEWRDNRLGDNSGGVSLVKLCCAFIVYNLVDDKKVADMLRRVEISLLRMVALNSFIFELLISIFEVLFFIYKSVFTDSLNFTIFNKL